MAYGIKYQTTWASLSSVKGVLYIEQLDYVGGILDLIIPKTSADDFKISYHCENWETRIIGITAEFKLWNENIFELLPLLTAEEREYRVRIVITDPVPQARILFEGFLNSATNSQKFLHKQEINLVASSFLSKLQYLTTDRIEIREGVYFINLIDNLLTSIGSEYNIRVNCSLFAENSPLSAGQTLFSKTGVFTELFWEDNVKRRTNEEILEIILVSFNCYIYWKDGYWYIERMDDIWTETPSYVEYTSGVIYDDTSILPIVNSTRTKADVHSLLFIEQSQTLYIDPGFKVIQLNLDIEDHLLLNLTINDFSNVPLVDVISPPVPATPRTWEASDLFTWDYLDAYRNMTNAIQRTDDRGNVTGLYTRFKMSVINTDIKLTISFRYGGVQGTIGGAPFTRWEDTELKFSWLLRESNTSNYIVYNSGTGEYDRVTTTERLGLNENILSGDILENTNEVGDVQFNIPIGDVDGVPLGLNDYTLMIGIEQIREVDTIDWYYMNSGIIGDTVVTASGELEDNEIKGDVNSKFLEKKEIEISLIDLQNENYISGVLQDNTLEGKTTGWKTASDPSFTPLVDLLLIDLFRLYNVSRQRIEADSQQITAPPIFSLFEDSKQADKKFMLLGSIFYPIYNQTTLNLHEFDTDTVVTLNDI